MNEGVMRRLPAKIHLLSRSELEGGKSRLLSRMMVIVIEKEKVDIKEKEKVDIIGHELVPRHEVLSAEEKKALLERLGVSEKNLPKILDTDSVIKKVAAKPGDVLKITRSSQTAGEAVYYRVVAEKPKH